MDPKTYSVRNPEELEAISRRHGLQVVLQLPLKVLSRSASHFAYAELLAYRVLVKPVKSFLPVLAPEHDQQCPLCNDGRQVHQRLDWAATECLIGPNPQDLYTMSQGRLLSLSGGFFWAALARVAQTALSTDPSKYPERDRKQVERECYHDSGSAIPGSSSPLLLSSSDFEVDADDIDEDEHENRQAKPEDLTHTERVGDATMTEVRPRIERLSTEALVAGKIRIRAEDDGGICKMLLSDHGWEVYNPCLALIEAKRAFKYVLFDEKTKSCTPVMSTEHLAQCFGEAVITWKGNQELLDDYVFVIAATNTFWRFCHFRFGRAYMDYLDAPDEAFQKRLVDDNRNDACVYATLSEQFNIQKPEGRRAAFCHTLSLVRHQDNQGSERAGGGDTGDSDEVSSRYESGADDMEL